MSLAVGFEDAALIFIAMNADVVVCLFKTAIKEPLSYITKR